jgi:hypothetical protein
MAVPGGVGPTQVDADRTQELFNHRRGWITTLMPGYGGKP